MSYDINAIVDVLKTTLKESVIRHKFYEDIPQTTAHEPANLAVLNRQAIGTISMALVQAMAEQRAQNDAQGEAAPALKVVGTSA